MRPLEDGGDQVLVLPGADRDRPRLAVSADVTAGKGAALGGLLEVRGLPVVPLQNAAARDPRAGAARVDASCGSRQALDALNALDALVSLGTDRTLNALGTNGTSRADSADRTSRPKAASLP